MESDLSNGLEILLRSVVNTFSREISFEFATARLPVLPFQNEESRRQSVISQERAFRGSKENAWRPLRGDNASAGERLVSRIF